MTSIARVFVPSVKEADGTSIGLGIFSTEETAWTVLRTFMRKSHLMSLRTASIVVWDVDMIGEEGMTVLTTMHCRDCPVCKRRTFWLDLEQFSAMCTGVNCEAWIEESTIETEKIDLGWPPTRFLKQTSTLEEALKELRVLGSELAATGYTPQTPITSIREE